MFEHLLESSQWDDSNKWSYIGFGEEIGIVSGALTMQCDKGKWEEKQSSIVTDLWQPKSRLTLWTPGKLGKTFQRGLVQNYDYLLVTLLVVTLVSH